MTNPDAAVEVCECGREFDDHIETPDFEEDGRYWLPENNCQEYKPKDDHYYADLADEARLERWESER